MNSLYCYLSVFTENISLPPSSELKLDILNPSYRLNLLSFSVNKNDSGDPTAYVVLALFLAASVALLLYSLRERTKSNRILQNGAHLRNDVLTKITHEFRTPLTIILGLSKQLREQKDLSGNNTLTYLTAIERQGRTLSDLVNQLLDMTNLHTTDDSVEWKTGNVVSFIEMIYETHSIYARQQGIELQFFSEEVEIETDFAPTYLQKILQNLLSNAIKYSEAGSKINIMLARSKKVPRKIILKVIDQGKGIKKEDLPHIFELFYKSPDSDSQTSRGIGLTLTKQLVEILNGTIRVESNEGKGSEFTVELPVRRNEKKLYPYWIPNKKNHLPIPPKNQSSLKEELFTVRPIDNDPRTAILLAEDNKDIAIYTRSIFSENRYNIIYCHDGVEALNLANEHLPDIVITDVIMPKKDGLELCREIKNSPLLSHIPVVIISAKNEEQDYIEGLKCGADAYIKKPFQAEEILVLVENLLKSRNLLKDKYHRTVIKDEKGEFNDNVNAVFLRHVTDIIYREMKNPDFSSKKLAQELAISVSQLNKKLNVTTGYPASTYILQVKLSFAKKILASQHKTIGEVAAECGVYDVNYFSRVFKKMTGVTPSQYKRLPVNL
ncbi:hybrid sensor histidine kinase/response regulator transcription factor [Proteiniphilum sp. UBA5510]|uniref:hybrid sensor histidine kinase/response regulator transcription factor n=1 Tax=Proteiniphilum sp. UBA5510 TaxID=1947286 RepID=UPI002580A955|nr:ATP-binding protein [Proteiniphilum sp. UBA5510]MDD4632126.1 response regulator [Proteiniphilum sp.]